MDLEFCYCIFEPRLLLVFQYFIFSTFLVLQFPLLSHPFNQFLNFENLLVCNFLSLLKLILIFQNNTFHLVASKNNHIYFKIQSNSYNILINSQFVSIAYVRTMTQRLTQTVGEWPEILVNTLYTEEFVLLFSVHISYFSVLL